MTGVSGVSGAAPGPPEWPPEVPPVVPPQRPQPPPVYPPVPMVYEPSAPTEELADQLLRRRIVLVTGTLDSVRAADASARLMLLDGSGDDPIDVVLSCPDGDLVAAMALADTVELVGVEVRSLCSGTIGGVAVLPYALASRRLAQPHSSFRLTSPSYDIRGRASDVAGEAAHQADLLSNLHRRLAGATGQTVDTVASDFETRRLLTAPQAKAYGLVDEIVHRRGLRTL